ncbi:hypothetical protein [Nonomuraea sp. NPDC002799]
MTPVRLAANRLFPPRYAGESASPPGLKAGALRTKLVAVRPDGHVEPGRQGPGSCRAFVREQAGPGFDSVEFLLSNDDVFIPGGANLLAIMQSGRFHKEPVAS